MEAIVNKMTKELMQRSAFFTQSEALGYLEVIFPLSSPRERKQSFEEYENFQTELF